MQKKLIALAVAGLMSGGAFAQSNVSISGLFRVGFEQYKLSDTGAASYSAENRVSDQSSMLEFSGKEDMGNGNYADFLIDQRFAPDTSVSGGHFGDGNTHVGIGGAWGALHLGRQDLHYGTMIEGYKVYSLQTILGNGLFAQVNGTTIANGTRTPNVIFYDTPNMSGLGARIAYSTQWSAANPVEGSGLNDGSKNGALNVALNYINGPIKAGYSYWDAKAEGGVTGQDQRGDTLQFGYAFPMGITAGIAYNKSRYDTVAGGVAGPEMSRNAWLLPVSYAFGASQVNVTYAKAGNTSNQAGSTGAKAWSLGYGYSLSKRTNVGVTYTKLTNDAQGQYNLFAIARPGDTAVGGAGGPVGSDVSQFYMGITHAF